jgi:hypothetical protein
MNTFSQLQKAAVTLSSDIHRQQEASNYRLSDACRRFREVEAEAPERILPVVAQGPPFQQPKTFSSGLFLRHTAPEGVNAFREKAEPKPDFSSLEQFRGCLMNPPDRFTTSRPEYFLDCWLEEEKARQRKRQYKRGSQTKRRREEKVVIPEVTVERMDEFGVVQRIVVGKSMTVDANSRTSSLENYPLLEEPVDMVDLPAVPAATKKAKRESVDLPVLMQRLAAARKAEAVPTKGLPMPKPRSNSGSRDSSSSSEGLPKPKRAKISQRPIEVTNIPEPAAPVRRSPFLDHITSGPGISGLTSIQSVPEVSVESVASTQRKSPKSFHDQIKAGGAKGLKKVKQQPRKKDFRPAFIQAIEDAKVNKPLKKVPPVPKVRDYRPAWIKEIHSKPQLNRVEREDSRPKGTTNPLFLKLEKMRKIMNPTEIQVPDIRIRTSSNWSELSSGY